LSIKYDGCPYRSHTAFISASDDARVVPAQKKFILFNQVIKHLHWYFVDFGELSKLTFSVWGKPTVTPGMA